MDDESGRGESVSPLVGGPKTHRSSVRPPVRPSSMHQAAVARAQPTCAAHLPCTRRRRHRAADRPSNQRPRPVGSGSKASRPSCRHRHQVGRYTIAAFTTCLSRCWRGGEGRGTQSTVAMQMADQASEERAKTDAACWLEGGREGGLHTVVVCYGRARSFASPLARLYGVDDGAKRRGRSKERKRIARAVQEAGRW